jgi:hypothetical protein
LSTKQQKSKKTLEAGKEGSRAKQERAKPGVPKQRQEFIANMHQELEKKIESIGGKPISNGTETRVDQ